MIEKASPTWTDAISDAYRATCEYYWPKANTALVLGRTYFTFEQPAAAHPSAPKWAATLSLYFGVGPGGAPLWSVRDHGFGRTKFLAFLHLAERSHEVGQRFLQELRRGVERAKTG